MEHRKAELQEVGPCDAPGDDPARFLRELRRLRIEAGLRHAELAARAHYPHEVIRAAEAGPSLPSLPVLSAYVRGCGGTAAEWEERWRSLTRSPALPLLPARPAGGGSEAASAGARVGAATAAADGHDPALIMAALDRVADGMAADPPSSSAAVIGSAKATATATATATASMSDAARLSRTPLSDSALLDSAVADAEHSAPGAGLPAPGAGLPAPGAWAATAADAAPGTDPQDTAAAVPSTAAAPGTKTAPRPADMPAVPSTPASGPAASSRSPLSPRAMIAVLVVVLCLAATVLALIA